MPVKKYSIKNEEVAFLNDIGMFQVVEIMGLLLFG